MTIILKVLPECAVYQGTRKTESGEYDCWKGVSGTYYLVPIE